MILKYNSFLRFSPLKNQLRLFASRIYEDPSFNVKQKLQRSEESLIVQHPWAVKPFQQNSQLLVPVFNFIDGKFANQVVDLDPNIYNQCIRRDIIHNTTKKVKNKAEVSGSGRKVRKQKGSGKARIGQIRSPHFQGGGKAWGRVPRDFSFPINQKIRIFALKSLISARLYEKKIIIIQNEKLRHGKSRYLEKIVKPFLEDRLLFLTPFNVDKKFYLASRAINNVRVSNPQQLSVQNIVKNDWLIMSLDGLQQFEAVIEGREQNLYRHRKIPREELEYDQFNPHKLLKKEKQANKIEERIIKRMLEERDEKVKLSDKPLHIMTPSLKGYIEDIKQLQADEKKKQLEEFEKKEENEIQDKV